VEQEKIVSDDKEDVLLEWEYRLPFLHISLLKKVLIAFGIPILITGIILAMRIGIVNGLIIMLIVTGVFLIGVFVAALVCANGFHFTFRLTADGIWSHMGKREECIANATTVGGILAGSSAATGAGLLAKAEQNVFIPWNNIKKVKVVEKHSFIKIGRSFGYKPIELYCSRENFNVALAIIRERLALKGT
jgi:hypothetical protein